MSRHLKYLNLGWSHSQRWTLLLFIIPKTISEGCIISAGVSQGDVAYGGLSPCLAALPVLGFQVSAGSRLVSVEERARIKCRERSASLMRQEGGTRCLGLDMAASVLSLCYRTRSAGAILGSALLSICFHLY